MATATAHLCVMEVS